MSKNILVKIFSLGSLLLSVLSSAESLTDTSHSHFFKEIEKELRDKYKNCTQDYSDPPIKKILIWKNEIDSFSQSPEYENILKDYYSSNKNIQNQSLCEILKWYKNKVTSMLKNDSSSIELSKLKKMQISDSLYTEKELSVIQSTCCDFQNIPFGLSKRSVLTLALKKGMVPLSDENHFLKYENPTDSVFRTVAFNFDENGRYYKYEIESVSKPIDSLDSHIRLYAKKFSSYFQQKIGNTSQQSNYVGRFEIVQGKLSIVKMWTVKNIAVYVGLSTFNNSYYAKAIVISKYSPDT